VPAEIKDLGRHVLPAALSLLIFRISRIGAALRLDHCLSLRKRCELHATIASSVLAVPPDGRQFGLCPGFST